jgi:ribosomal protein S18 acetylase RimI-like enzyme
MSITIGVPKLSDVDSMIMWGKENRELWGGEDETWYLHETLVEWIKHPGKDVILIAKSDTIPIGMCLVHALRDWAFCSSLFVKAAFRKQGVGKMLLTKAMDQMKRQGIVNFSLVVQENNIKAQKFYQSLGLTPGFRFIWMEKKLL